MSRTIQSVRKIATRGSSRLQFVGGINLRHVAYFLRNRKNIWDKECVTVVFNKNSRGPFDFSEGTIEYEEIMDFLETQKVIACDTTKE